MSSEITKKAIEMLLKGATLLSDPCPYCKGVRVMKDGLALCVSCGREGGKEDYEKSNNEKSESELKAKLEKKLRSLSDELEHEKDAQKQQQILRSINDLIEIIAKLKK